MADDLIENMARIGLSEHHSAATDYTDMAGGSFKYTTTNIDDSKQHRVALDRTRIPEATILDDTFEIGDFLRSEKHADVYRVAEKHDRVKATQRTILEARAFCLDGLSDSVAAYRRRSIRRLRSRTISTIMWNGLQVVIYRPDPGWTAPVVQAADKDAVVTLNKEGRNPSKSNHAEARAPLKVTNVPDTASRNPPHTRTSYQQEARRLRQRDRRQCRKQQPRQSQADQGAFQPGNVIGGLKFDDDTTSMVIILHLLHDANAAKRARIPEALRSSLDAYVKMRDEVPPLATEQEMSEFLDVKQRELAFLSRRLAQLATIVELYNSRLKDLMYRQMACQRGDEDWKLIAQQKKAQMDEYTTLYQAHNTLRAVVASVREVIRLLKDKLSETRQEQREATLSEIKRAKKAHLEKSIDRYEEWSGYVMPSSATYISLGSKGRTARETLQRLE